MGVKGLMIGNPDSLHFRVSELTKKGGSKGFFKGRGKPVMV